MQRLKNLFGDIVMGRDPKLQRDAFTVLLGLVGLILLAGAYPFGWQMPAYAAY
ncbi:MAG: hypothetical protein ACRBB0_26625 [Pelagimonas sp.]|uniref:hypothetical protein n=1 Tax=Pelagimonas sp. TaxID=2073170 RepID=UPI003D6A983E